MFKTMDVQQGSTDPCESDIKTEPDVIFDQTEGIDWCSTKQQTFNTKVDYVPVFGDRGNICEYQVTAHSVKAGKIKREIVECVVPKIEYPDFPEKIGSDSIQQFVSATIKKELNVHGVVNISETKQEVSDSEYIQVKIERELLTTYCDLPTLKSEDTEYLYNFEQPQGSKLRKHAGMALKIQKNTPNVSRNKKRKLYPFLVCQKNFPYKSRSKHIDGYSGKSVFVCEFCGKLMTKIDLFWHYFNHLVKKRTRKESPKDNDVSSTHKHLKIFTCDICSKEFNRKSHLHSHLIIHTDERPFKCDVCFKSFKRKKAVKQHLICHTNEKPFKCDICYKKFKRKDILQEHLIIHTDAPRIACDICSKVFKHKSLLKRHLTMHTDKEPLECDICSEKFTCKFDILEHKHIFHCEEEFKCQICSKKFKFKCQLQNHLISHCDVKPFPCDICSKKFKRKSNLQEHFRMLHSDKKPFTCDICLKDFSTNSILQRHVIIHTNEKPFKCEVCFKGFKRKKDIKRHLIIHTDERPFKCDICSKGFNKRFVLQQHLIIHTNEKPFKCDICSKDFNQKSNFKKHLTTHGN